MKIYLASGSPRRKELLGWMGLKFEVIEHEVDEKSVKSRSLKDLAGELALRKADSVVKKIKTGLVIGSDLIVDFKGKQLGKPKDLKEAKKTLKILRNKTHMIYCGVAVLNKKTDEIVMSVAETKVKMKDYSDEIIEKYVNNYKVLDKGGSYAIQDKIKGFGSLVKSFEGGITTIIGLPLDYLENLLIEFGIKPKKNWEKECKLETGYEY